jgi:hypothetical protein
MNFRKIFKFEYIQEIDIIFTIKLYFFERKRHHKM